MEKNCTSRRDAPDATLCTNTGNFSDALRCIGHGSSFDPWWGERRSEHLQNAGFVIGFKTRSISWRLDYDPAKGIHVNQEVMSPGAVSGSTVTTATYHVVRNFDAMPIPSAYLPDELKKRGLTDEQKVRVMLLAWTRIYAPFMKDTAKQATIMTAYPGMQWGDFVKAISNARHIADVAWCFTPPPKH
jgi:hypothetical protein